MKGGVMGAVLPPGQMGPGKWAIGRQGATSGIPYVSTDCNIREGEVEANTRAAASGPMTPIVARYVPKTLRYGFRYAGYGMYLYLRIRPESKLQRFGHIGIICDVSICDTGTYPYPRVRIRATVTTPIRIGVDMHVLSWTDVR